LVCFINMLILFSFKMTLQTVEEKTLTNKLFIIFFSSSISFFFIFPSFCSLYTSFSILSFSVFSFLQPTLILSDLSCCHKFVLLLMSLMPQINGTFIKIECFKMKPCPSQKKMTRVHGSNMMKDYLVPF